MKSDNLNNLKKDNKIEISSIIADFSNRPMRLFFLSGCLAVIVSTLFWVFHLVDSNLRLFLLLQSFAGAIYTGFLFTAIPKWTKYKKPLSTKMIVLWIIWLLAFVTAFFSTMLAFIMMAVFWCLVLLLVASMTYGARDERQISFCISLACITILTVFLAINSGVGNLDQTHWQYLIYLMTAGFMITTFRIGRATGLQALRDGNLTNSQFIQNPYFKNLQVILIYTLFFVDIISNNHVIIGWIYLSVAGSTLGRLRDWHFAVLLKQHYVRWLYVALLTIGIAYGVSGLMLIGLFDIAMPQIQTITTLTTFSGLLLLLLQVMNFASLRHSNSEVIYPLWGRMGLFAVLLSIIAIYLGITVVDDLSHYNYKVYLTMYIPNILILVAFLMYLPTYYRVFVNDLREAKS